MPSIAQNIVDLIGQYVDRLRTVGAISSLTDNGNGTWTLEVSNIDSLTVDSFITIGSEKYQIIGVDTGAGEITIESETTVAGTEWKSCAPYYYHGTPMMVNKEIQNTNESTTKAQYSAVILWEVIRQDFNRERTNLVGNTSRLIMSFLDTNNRVDWTSDEHYDLVIDNMEDLANQFIQILHNAPEIAKFNDYTYLKHANWGTVVRDKGHNKYILDDNLSGLNLEINLPIKRNCLVDKQGTALPIPCAPVSIVDGDGNLIEYVDAGGKYVDGDTTTLRLIFPDGSLDELEFTIVATEIGTYKTDSTVNITSYTLEVNSNPVTLPFTVGVGDVFKAVINRTAIGDAELTLNT